MNDSTVRFSKFLSLVLRHDPEKIGLTLDAAGWAQVDDLLVAANRSGVPLTRPQLEQIVTQNDKQRFALSTDGTRIRASQGHSISVDLGLEPLMPPERLYHGTATRFLDSIKTQGLLTQSRNHVHLSADEATAIKVGQRHGKPVVLTVQAGQMQRDGFLFYRSANGVWLTGHVPVIYLHIPVA